MLTFISFWRAAAIVLCDLGSSAFYAGGIAEHAVGAAAPWFILGIMLFSFAVRAVYVESCSMFTRGGVYRVVKEALGGTFAKLSVSALMFDYILTGPISGVSAGQYITGLMNELLAVAASSNWLPPALMDAHHNPSFLFDMNYTSAVFAAAVTIYYWWQNVKGIEESSEKALQVMQITTIMVVILLVWGVYSAFIKGGHLPPPPTVQNLKFSDDALGFLRGTKLVPLLGVFGILMAFGHSLLAMSGEESLAQVNREIEHPKLRNLKRAAIVIAIYSLIFTGGGTILAYMLIPLKDHVMYQDNLIAGLAMNLVGPMFLRIAFRIFVVVVGFLILSGAINTSMIGSTGVLMRVAEDGVLTDWFRKPHQRFGTSYRIVNLVFILQMTTIIFSRGNIIILGEAYAFGVIWSFTFNSLAMLVLRWKYHGARLEGSAEYHDRQDRDSAGPDFGLPGAAVDGAGEPGHQISSHGERHRFCGGVLRDLLRVGAAEQEKACHHRTADERPLPDGTPGHGEPRVGSAAAGRGDGHHARRGQPGGVEVDPGAHQHG
jgi:amino acid transporter